MLAWNAQANLLLMSDDFSSSSIVEGSINADDAQAMGVVGSGTWQATGGTEWTINNAAGGSANNAGGGTAAQNEGIFGRLVNIGSVSDLNLDKLQLDVDFTTAEAAEELFVHLRGYIENTPDADPLVNMSATNGNAWNDADSTTDWTIYNLNSGQLNNHYSDYSNAGFAVALHDGSAGAHNFSQTFDMSGYATEANAVAKFDYLGVYVTRNHLGTSPSVSISNLSITAVPEPSSLALLAFATGLLRTFRNRLAPARLNNF